MNGRCKYCRNKVCFFAVRARDLDTIEICGSDDCADRAFYEHHPECAPSWGPPT